MNILKKIVKGVGITLISICVILLCAVYCIVSLGVALVMFPLRFAISIVRRIIKSKLKKKGNANYE